jgi:CBS domain-containing protein
MKARDIMTDLPTVITADEPLWRAAEIMAHIDIGMVPVVDGYTTMRPEGVITDRDIALRHVGPNHGPGCTVRDHMTSDNLAIVRPEDHVHDVIGRMKHHHIRRVLVVNSQHRLVGVIATSDIARQIGPDEPKRVEQLFEEVSAPAGALAGV